MKRDPDMLMLAIMWSIVCVMNAAAVFVGATPILHAILCITSAILAVHAFIRSKK